MLLQLASSLDLEVDVVLMLPYGLVFIFKFLLGQIFEHRLSNVMSFYTSICDLVAMMSIFSSESSKMLGEASTFMSVLSGYLSNLMRVLFLVVIIMCFCCNFFP